MKSLRLISLFLFFALSALNAQEKAREIGITLFGGGFSATSEIIAEDLGLFGEATAKHVSATAFGAHVTNWVSPNIGVESTVAFTPSAVEVSGLGLEEQISAGLFFSSIKFLVGGGTSSRFHLGFGIGLVTSSYDEFLGGDTHLTGALGAAVSIPIGKSIALRLGVDNNIHTVFWEFDGVESESKLQNDLVFGLGLTVRNTY
ncbi:MAG: hypothetical protein ACRBF0_22410 [Calditrichia bacterium]